MKTYSEPLLLVRLGFPPATNHVYGYTTSGKGGKARSYLRESGVRYKQEVMVAVKDHCPDFAIPPKTPIYLNFAFFCTPKTYNKRDIDGNLKVLIDELFRVGGGNDRYVRELAATKERGSEDAVVVTMREILEGG